MSLGRKKKRFISKSQTVTSIYLYVYVYGIDKQFLPNKFCWYRALAPAKNCGICSSSTSRVPLSSSRTPTT